MKRQEKKNREQCNNATNFHAPTSKKRSAPPCCSQPPEKWPGAGVHSLASFKMPLDLSFSRRPRYRTTDLLLARIPPYLCTLRQERKLWLRSRYVQVAKETGLLGSRVFVIIQSIALAPPGISGKWIPDLGKRQIPGHSDSGGGARREDDLGSLFDSIKSNLRRLRNRDQSSRSQFSSTEGEGTMMTVATSEQAATEEVDVVMISKASRTSLLFCLVGSQARMTFPSNTRRCLFPIWGRFGYSKPVPHEP